MEAQVVEESVPFDVVVFQRPLQRSHGVGRTPREARGSLEGRRLGRYGEQFI